MHARNSLDENGGAGKMARGIEANQVRKEPRRREGHEEDLGTWMTWNNPRSTPRGLDKRNSRGFHDFAEINRCTMLVNDFFDQKELLWLR